MIRHSEDYFAVSVVPAQAGTHDHLPREMTQTVVLGPRLRGDDE
jgi:hypothetical protein